MVIHYDKYPILRFFNKNLLPQAYGKINIAAEDITEWSKHCDAETIVQYVVGEMYRGYIAERCSDNIYILTREFLSAMNRSAKAFYGLSRGVELDKLFEDCCIIEGNIVYVGYKLRKETFIGWELAKYTNDSNYLISIYYQGKTENSPNNCIVYLGSLVFGKGGDDGYLFETALLSTKLGYNTSDEDLEHIADRFLGILVFKHYAKVELEFVKGKEKKSTSLINQKISNETISGIKIMDSLWYTSIFREEGFSVRGHFRLQPKKNAQGEWVRELIYINEFQKQGYHRHAKILDDPTAEPDTSELEKSLQSLTEKGYTIK